MKPGDSGFGMYSAAVVLLFVITNTSVAQAIEKTTYRDNPAMVTVGKEFNNREVKIRVGGLIRVELGEPGSALGQWGISKPDLEHFDILKSDTQGMPDSRDLRETPRLGTWIIRALKEGKSDLVFLRCRSLEEAKAASDIFVLKVRVIP